GSRWTEAQSLEPNALRVGACKPRVGAAHHPFQAFPYQRDRQHERRDDEVAREAERLEDEVELTARVDRRRDAADQGPAAVKPGIDQRRIIPPDHGEDDVGEHQEHEQLRDRPGHSHATLARSERQVPQSGEHKRDDKHDESDHQQVAEVENMDDHSFGLSGLVYLGEAAHERFTQVESVVHEPRVREPSVDQNGNGYPEHGDAAHHIAQDIHGMALANPSFEKTAYSGDGFPASARHFTRVQRLNAEPIQRPASTLFPLVSRYAWQSHRQWMQRRSIASPRTGE